MNLLTALGHIVGAGSPATEGEVSYNSTRKYMGFHNSVREIVASDIGYMPYVYPIGGGPDQSATTVTSGLLAANGGSFAVPVALEGHMLLDSLTFRDGNTTLTRGPVEFALYEDRLNNTNTLDLVTGAVGSIAQWTATAAVNRDIPVTSPPVYLPTGCYWLAMKNNHATNACSIGVTAAGTMALNVWQTKGLTAGSALPSTLDLVAATWTKGATTPGVRLNGRVFGQTVDF